MHLKIIFSYKITLWIWVCGRVIGFASLYRKNLSWEVFEISDIKILFHLKLKTKVYQLLWYNLHCTGNELKSKDFGGQFSLSLLFSHKWVCLFETMIYRPTVSCLHLTLICDLTTHSFWFYSKFFVLWECRNLNYPITICRTFIHIWHIVVAYSIPLYIYLYCAVHVRHIKCLRFGRR